MRKPRLIISLCDYSGNWPRAFLELNPDYRIVLVDPKHRGNPWYRESKQVLKFNGTVDDYLRAPWDTMGLELDGIIMQPVCTQFAGSGARWWKHKDTQEPGLLEDALQLVRDCLALKDALKPRWWIMENPVGRLGRLIGMDPVMTYQPHEYAALADNPNAEQYTKRTCLWGDFDHAELQRMKSHYTLPPIHGSAMWAKYGGKSERTKELRSMTPIGFSRAFALAHCAIPEYVL